MREWKSEWRGIGGGCLIAEASPSPFSNLSQYLTSALPFRLPLSLSLSSWSVAFCRPSSSGLFVLVSSHPVTTPNQSCNGNCRPAASHLRVGCRIANNGLSAKLYCCCCSAPTLANSGEGTEERKTDGQTDRIIIISVGRWFYQICLRLQNNELSQKRWICWSYSLLYFESAQTMNHQQRANPVHMNSLQCAGMAGQCGSLKVGVWARKWQTQPELQLQLLLNHFNYVSSLVTQFCVQPPLQLNCEPLKSAQGGQIIIMVVAKWFFAISPNSG